MGLQVMYATGSSIGNAVITWNVGQDPDDIRAYASSVVSVRAEGHELEYISRRFVNLPTPVVRNSIGNSGHLDYSPAIRANKKLNSLPTSTVWFGDTAKFIVANL